MGIARKDAHCFVLDLTLEAAADGHPATPGETVQIVEPTQRKLAQKEGDRSEVLVQSQGPNSNVSESHTFYQCVLLLMSLDDLVNFVSHSVSPSHVTYLFNFAHVGLGWLFYGL